MADKYKQDPTKYKPSVGGTDVKDTSMLKGQGAFTAAQNEQNETVPYTTGKAPKQGNLGGEASH
jgi:hypothetical protein